MQVNNGIRELSVKITSPLLVKTIAHLKTSKFMEFMK